MQRDGMSASEMHQWLQEVDVMGGGGGGESVGCGALLSRGRGGRAGRWWNGTAGTSAGHRCTGGSSTRAHMAGRSPGTVDETEVAGEERELLKVRVTTKPLLSSKAATINQPTTELIANHFGKQLVSLCHFLKKTNTSK